MKRNKQDILKGLIGFLMLVLADCLKFCREKLWLALCVVVFVVLFINTFFVYQWCHIDSESLLLSCDTAWQDVVFNHLTAHVLYQTIYIYNQVFDTYSYTRLLYLSVSSVMSIMFVVGFIVLSFSIFNLPWRLYEFIKGKELSSENPAEVKSD